MVRAKVFNITIVWILISEFHANPGVLSYEIAESELESSSSNRHLQAPIPKLKIKLTRTEYKSQDLMVYLQDPCTVSTTFTCTKNPEYAQNQIPNTIRVPLSSSSSGSDKVFEYTGYYNLPISIDIYYYTTRTFILEKYSDQNLSGTYAKDILPTLAFFVSDTATNRLKPSFKAYAYLKGPRNGDLGLSFHHDDEGRLSINGVLICSYSGYGIDNCSYEFVKDLLYYVEIIVNDKGGGGYGLELKWNVSSNNSVVDSTYMVTPIRIPGMPHLLTELKYNTYCDDLDGFKCLVCNGLCVECEDNSIIKSCISCKANSYLSSGSCICNPRYYLSNSDSNNCKSCTGLCAECEEIEGNYKCKSCQINASLDQLSGTCTCNSEYYLSLYSPRECIQCNPLCSICEERLGSQVCLACKDFARIESNICICIEGYYKPYSDPYPLRCYECPLSCKSCEEDYDGIYCSSCKEYASLIQRSCECIEGYYFDDEVRYECQVCEGLCKTCGKLECTTCVDNAEIRDGKCYCKEGYYRSNTDNELCISCMNEFCKTCLESDGIYECTSCIYPYILYSSSLCVCEEDYYNILDNTCNRFDFSMELNPSLNKLGIVFNQALLRSIQFSDLNHIILEQDISSKIDIDFYTLEDQLSYCISYNSTYSIEAEITVTLSIEDSVQNIQRQVLKTRNYTSHVPILFIENTLKNDTSPSNSTEELQHSELAFSDMNISMKSCVITVVSTVSALNLINMNTSSIWMILNTLQIFSYSILLNINIPAKILTIAKGMSFDFLPNIFELFMANEMDSVPKRYKEADYRTTKYLLNAGDLITIFLINTACYLLLKLTNFIFRRSQSKIMSIVSRAIKEYEWSFYLRFFIQSYLDIAVSSSFTLKYLPRGTEVPDYVIATITYVKST